MTTAAHGLSAEPRAFGRVQRLAHDCAEAVAARLEPGVTEREAARIQREWPREVRERRSPREIYADVDRLMARRGCADRHRAHPFGVIAHKVDRARERRFSPRLFSPRRFGFGARSLGGLVSDAVHGHREGWSPRWSPYRFSDHPPGPGPWAEPGPWAGEPHLGFRGAGAKFEEVLVVTDSRDPVESAFRLDDDLPHVRRWAEDR